MKKLMFSILFLLVLAVVIYVWKALPIISGYSAKILCSGVFVCNRTPEDVIENELGSFPLNLSRTKVDLQDSSVTATIWGLAKKKAVYRKGSGATLINEISEQAVRSQTFNIATPPVINQDTIDWPDGNRLKNTIRPDIDKQQLNAALEEAFKEPAKHVRRTRAVVVVYNGEIIAEQYAEGFSDHSKLAGWSMTKGVTNALLGILVKQKKLDINAPAPVDSWKNDDRSKITIADLMHMSSGLRWWEYYKAPSDATNMLYNKKSMGEFAMRKPLKNKPGTVLNYSSGSTNLLSYIIGKTIGDNDYHRFPYEQLFYKIGMLSAVLEVDAAGTFVGSSYCYATARDWARFGLLYLNDGVWNGERILPEDWVKFTTTPTTAKSTPEQGKYGALWWLNTGDKDNPSNRKYPHVPEDCYRCQGYEGQYIWVIPSKKLVVVRLAIEKDDSLDPDVFLPAIIKALPE